MTTKKIDNIDVGKYLVTLDDGVFVVYTTDDFYYRDDEVRCCACESRDIETSAWTATEFLATCSGCGCEETVTFEEYL